MGLLGSPGHFRSLLSLGPNVTPYMLHEATRAPHSIMATTSIQEGRIQTTKIEKRGLEVRHPNKETIV